MRARREEIALWQVELDSPDSLLVENFPLESHLPLNDLGLVEPSADAENAGALADHRLPIAVDAEVTAFVRERLWERARDLGWTTSSDDDLRLLVDGRVRRPLIEFGAAAFLFPADARDVRLRSDTFTPADLGGKDDRVLGAMLLGLVFSGSNGETRRISVDDQRLRKGVHPVEGDTVRFRWTTGELILDPDLWAGLSGAVSLLVSCNRFAARHYWIAPPTRESPAQARPRLYSVG